MTWLKDAFERIADDMPERDLAARAMVIHQRRRRNRTAFAAAAVVVVTVLAAWLGIRVLPETPREPAAPVSRPEQTTIEVGAVPSAASAPLFVAVAKGYFEQEGLSVTPHIIVGGPAGVPKVLSGELDLSQTDYLTTMKAVEQGHPLKLVSGLYQARAGTSALVVRPGSGIRSVAGLKGKKIGVPYLRSTEEFALAGLLEQAGLSLDDVKLVETPLPDMGMAMDRRRFDAALATEPHITQGVQQGQMRVLKDLMTGEFAGLPGQGWMAADTWIQRNPATLAAFQRALGKAHRVIADDPREVEAVLPYYVKIPRAQTAAIKQGGYPTAIDLPGLRRLAELGRRHGFLKGRFDVREAVLASR
ncbi:ABC transporter substrate-binding protein [Nonomuraea gerenzanensis]|uniref:Putative extracellular solute-binding protein n=1 Tax=Nonomuraea gerenzanensis TaxID=93944 RepID=A0A1M4EJ83_9ACTN|nr:ABC transporter substrate-binding protein [Nonomuraea gerenzanensis]UBU10255.1 ABC transporter substrate-binding protein [Nonomuraea gerenzanensis]SBO98633.1 putative extracellular solute-binding protein [Nonomuraea gerenzanensis]